MKPVLFNNTADVHYVAAIGGCSSPAAILAARKYGPNFLKCFFCREMESYRSPKSAPQSLGPQYART